MIISKELKVHYYLRHKEVKGDGATPIMGRITIGKSMVQFSAKYPFGIQSLHGQQVKAKRLPS